MSSFMQQLTDKSVADNQDTALLEWRAAIRHAFGRECKCRLALESSAPSVRAWCIDISADGVGLIVEEHFGLRSLLLLEMNFAAGDPIRLRLMRVQHVAEWGPKRWWLGCKLSSSLTEQELKRLLVEPREATAVDATLEATPQPVEASASTRLE